MIWNSITMIYTFFITSLYDPLVFPRVEQKCNYTAPSFLWGFSSLYIIWLAYFVLSRPTSLLRSYLIIYGKGLQQELEAKNTLFLKKFTELCTFPQKFQPSTRTSMGVMLWRVWEIVDMPFRWNILKDLCKTSKLEIILLSLQPEKCRQKFPMITIECACFFEIIN